MTKIVGVLSVYCGLLLTASCTGLAGHATLENWAPPPHSDHQSDLAFTGILLGERQPPDPVTRYVFNIHGMGMTKDDYNVEMGRRLVADFGYTLQNSGDWTHVSLAHDHVVSGEGISCLPSNMSVAAPSAVSINCLYDTFGRYKVDRYERQRPEGGHDSLVVYTFFWQDDLWRIQSPYLAEDIARNRALINGALKNSLVDEGFSDAVGYLGNMQPIVIDGIQGALCVMLKDALHESDPAHHQLAAVQSAEVREHDALVQETRTIRSPEVPGGGECLAQLDTSDLRPDIEFNFVSHSLGSRMLLDALTPYAANESEDAVNADGTLRDVARRTRTMFMAANQVPLLGIGSVDIDSATRAHVAAAVAPPCNGPTFFDCRGSRGAHGTADPFPLDVVAFLDPDDVLGFSANSGMMGLSEGGSARHQSIANVHFVTVVHRNTSQWLWTLALPQEAHDRELHHASSVNFIFCGAVTRDGRTPIARHDPQNHTCSADIK